MRQRFEDNLARVKHLVNVYTTLGGVGQGRRPVNSTDLLRAATVFLHAAIEDLLRSIEAARLPAAAPPVLDGVPLVGLGPRPEKFFLGQLAPHRGSTVDDVIRRSVEAHLERATYGNATEVLDTITQ